MDFIDILETCRVFIETLTHLPVEKATILKWFQDLCTIFIDIINTIGKLNKTNREKFNKPTRDTIILYLTQLITCLNLLRQTFIEEENLNTILIQARRCIKQQIVYCLDSLEDAIVNQNIITNPAGNFVKWMDDALNTINRIDIVNNNQQTNDLLKQTRELFEEVLSHAMSIAQISLSEDCRIIRAGCQIVLETLNSLSTELKNIDPNPTEINLLIDICCNKLCSLERKVNTSVLKLSLNTFKQFTKPLEIIHNYCYNQELHKNRDDFDNFVVEFDLHVDRIMQIGLFAVSCSSDSLRGTKIRSCLASLEALESELVPSFNAVLLEKNEQNRYFSEILENHWINQAKSLQQLIYLIIDPFAFCQIIYEEAKEIVDNLAKVVKFGKTVEIANVNNLIDIANVLGDFLNKARREFDKIELERIDSKIDDFTKIVNELRNASKILLNSNNDNNPRILKRCKILLTMIKRLWYCFADDCLKHDQSVEEIARISSKFENLPLKLTNNHFLDHLIDRGKQILEQRSILYRSTIEKSRITKNLNENRELSMKHLRKLSFINCSNKKSNNIDNQIKELLNEITNLSTIQN